MNPLPGGLVSGMKKLSDNGAGLIFTCEDSALKSVLESEGLFSSDGKASYFISVTDSPEKEGLVLIGSEEIKNFSDAAEYLIRQKRKAVKIRNTKETKIKVEVELDGNGTSKINTGIGFFDHMLEQIARHGNINLFIAVKGDLLVDEHHTVEDTGIALGEAILEALGDKRGIKRYGYFIPMDESIARCAMDFSGRIYLNFKCRFKREKVGEFPTELTEEFFRGLAFGMKANLYLKAKGSNDHHKIEALFKVFAKSLNEACRRDERTGNVLPSTKGVL